MPVAVAPGTQPETAEAAPPERPAAIPAAPGGFLTPEQVAAEVTAQQPPAPTWLESIAHVVRHVQGKIAEVVNKIPGATPVLHVDQTIGEYLKGLMAGTTEP